MESNDADRRGPRLRVGARLRKLGPMREREDEGVEGAMMLL